MQIDRSLFLFFTGAIAAGACQKQPETPENVIVVPTATASAVPIASGPPMWTDPKPAQKPPPSPPSEEGMDDEDDDDPLGEGGMGPAPRSVCGHTSVRFDPTRSGCNDAMGAPAACANMMTPAGCGTFPFPRTKCDAYRAAFKPKIAERAVACALRLTGREVCDACNTYRCGYEALMSACLDPTADTDCQQILASCKQLAMSECRAYLSGMNPIGRRKMVQCVTGSCGRGFYSCAEGV